MTTKSKGIVDAFEHMSEVGNGALTVPPNKEEQEERDRLMQDYLKKLKRDKLAQHSK